MESILRLENVVKVYENRRAVNGVSLTLGAGEAAAICGPLSSGKTTLLRLISGVERPDSGRVFAPKRIGVVQEQDGLICEYTILENVSLPLTKTGERSARKQAKLLLEQLDIGYIAGAKPERVSPIERRLAALARAAMGGPELLILDELTAGFSEREAGLLWEGLNQTKGDGAVLLLTSEDSPPTLKVYTMERGQLLERDRSRR